MTAALGGLLLTACSAVSQPSNETTWRWEAAAALPVARQEIYADVRGDIIYLLGGFTPEMTPSTDLIAFDARRNSWEALSPLPRPRHHATVSIVGARLFGVGGFEGDGMAWRAQPDVFVHDLATGAWSPGPPLPEPRGEHVSAVVGERIFITGGRLRSAPDSASYEAHSDTVSHIALDARSGRWSRLADAPTARNSAASAVIDGKIYVVGGRQYTRQPDGTMGNENVAALEVYDPATDRWETRRPMPVAQGGLSAATLDGKLYAFGGERWLPSQAVLANAWVYDPAGDSWMPLPNMRTPRHGTAAATANGRIFVLGGATKTGAGAVSANEALTPAR